MSSHFEEKTFITGVESLDRLIGAIRAPYTILVAGHPGAGKTTLASTICYHNALKGRKCLYVTFYEDKDKLYSYMKKLGMPLSEVESKGLMRFLKLPAIHDVDSVVDVLNKNVIEGFDLIVIDSITVLLEAVKDHTEKRAWLLNYFYQLPILVNGLLVLVSELPFGEERLGLGSIEFVVDAILILKHRVEDHLLLRLLEIRKARGAPIHVAEVPFTIAEGRGLLVYTQPVLEELPPGREAIELTCSALRSRVGHVHKDFFINIFYPPETVYGERALIMLLAQAIKYNLKILVVSYISSPELLRGLLLWILEERGLSRDVVEKVIDRYLVFRGINPFAYNVHELVMKELALVEEVKPDIVVFHGVQVVEVPIYHFKELYKQVLYLKSRGIGIVRVGSCINDVVCDSVASIADLTLKVKREYREKHVDTRVIVLRRFHPPSIITGEEDLECFEENINTIVQEVSKQA
ncbi:MAG: ATPase domain-containing protein [Desulfurococcaceae archaeon]